MVTTAGGTDGGQELLTVERVELARLRDEAQTARTELHAAVIERDLLLREMREANEQLVIATVRADEAAERAQANDRAKDEFLAMLGHELRNPLAPILAAVGLMAFKAPKVFERERTIIERQVNSLVRLVDDLLDVSRITRGKFELHRARIELSVVVAQAIEIAEPLIHAKAHTLVVKVSPQGLAIDGDSVRLAQAVGNLLTNAAKYTPGHGTIEITGEARGSSVRLSVRDSGIGISEEMLPRVFDSFAQERQALDRSLGGLGLGLTIVRSLISMHGGTVTARSDGIGRGAEFVLELPVAPPPDVGAEPAGELHTASALAPLRILIVDDNHDIAELTAEALAALGHEVRVEFDGAAALQLVEHFHPDIALLDIGLPEMDGYELVHRLRAMLSSCPTRFIAISGYAQNEDRDRSRAAGFDAHLAKPVALVELRDTIDRFRPTAP